MKVQPAVEGPGLKESCKDVEAQHHEESLRKAVVQLQQTLAFWSCRYHGRSTTNTSSCGVELARAWKTNRVCCSESSQKSEPALGGVQSMVCGAQSLDIPLFTLLRVWLCFAHILTLPWLFPLEKKNRLFFILQESIVEGL